MVFTYYLPTLTGTIDKKETEFNSVQFVKKARKKRVFLIQ